MISMDELRLPATAAIGASRESSPLVEDVVGLFDQLRDRLLRYSISFGLPVEEGEDVVQEVFLALFQHLQQGRSRQNLRAWTFRVAHNLALKRRNLARVDEPTTLAEVLPDASPSPEEQAANSQRRERALAVVKALPEQDRRCLILRAEGLRYREIAQVLDISLGAVCMSLERSLARLARANRW
jgi:RNA polymerase sigma-70 factor (ECF subfamily)